MRDFQVSEDVGAAAGELVAELEEGLVLRVVVVFFVLIFVVVVMIVVLLRFLVMGAAFGLVVADFGGPGFVQDVVV